LHSGFTATPHATIPIGTDRAHTKSLDRHAIGVHDTEKAVTQFHKGIVLLHGPLPETQSSAGRSGLRGADPASSSGIHAPWIGFVIAFIIMVEAPLTMACINPARDLGPRIAISILYPAAL
jgi:glycerol uptake facilitator-like aquaporin